MMKARPQHESVVILAQVQAGLVMSALALATSSAGCGTDSGSQPEAGVGDASIADAGDAGVARDAQQDVQEEQQLAPDAVTPGPDAAVPYSWTPKPCGFYAAATGGNDGNPGTSAQPFATVTRLQKALRGAAAPSKVGCLKAGSGGAYDLTATLVLQQGTDDGETWESDPAGGVNSAVLDGKSTLPCLIQTDASDITIDGLKLQHVVDNLTCHDDGKTTISNLTIVNSDIGFNSAGAGSGGFPPCLMANGAKGVTVKHNYVHDCASQGIGLFAYQAGLVLDDVVVDSNFVLRAVQVVPDGGAIYLILVANYTASSIHVTNNFVRDYGTATVPNAHGVYLDEGTNHVVVRGNTIGAPTVGSGKATGCLIADGHDNRFEGNICDLGTSGVAWAGVWWYPGSEQFTPGNNSYTGNIVVSRFSGNQRTSAFGVSGPSFVQIASPAKDPTITGNMFHDYGGGQVRTDGNVVGDSSPLLADPLCSGNLYALASSSPALSAPMSFVPIVGGWGPPGFVVPDDSNRSCP